MAVASCASLLLSWWGGGGLKFCMQLKQNIKLISFSFFQCLETESGAAGNRIFMCSQFPY